MIQLLYTRDHATRGEALASVTPGCRHGLIDKTPPKKIHKLHTLVFWGHGDAARFCDLDARGLVRLIGKWRVRNPGLKTIEIITCNARHCTYEDPYVEKVKRLFKGRARLFTFGLTLRALPVSVGGIKESFSILLAEPVHKSWAYITAPGKTDALMMEAQNLIRYEKTAGGKSVTFKGDLAKRADALSRSRKRRKWTLNYGYLDTLRRNLVDV